jgi:hypothetical protein
MHYERYVLEIVDRFPEPPVMETRCRDCGRYAWQGMNVNLLVPLHAVRRHEEEFHPVPKAQN